MKIKLAILEKDQSYLSRIVSAFNTKYSENFEVYSFTDADVAMENLDSAKIEVLLASDAFEIDAKKLPKRCGLAYLVDSVDIETYNGQRAIGRFQRADLIYKQILSIYSENAGNVSRLVLGDDATKIIAFQSVSGGCGASTLAAATALRFAQAGKKTLYLNLEKFGSADVFFSGEGQFDMTDVIFALKSKKANLSLKLESCVKQDPRGVCFYSQSKIALDMVELKAEDIAHLLSELKLAGSYQTIILDLDFALTKQDLNVLDLAHSIIWVSDGSEIANGKFLRALNALKLLEGNSESPVSSRISTIYSKFSSKTAQVLTDIGIKNVGGTPRYEHATTQMLLEQISKMAMLDELL